MTLQPCSLPARTAYANPTCKRCGTDHVVCDAWAAWDTQERCWVLQALFDHAVCNRCEAATTLAWSPPDIEEQEL